MSGGLYWSGSYWQANYWNEDYWVETTGTVSVSTQSLTLTAYNVNADVDSQDYYSDDYWAVKYWNPTYWASSNVTDGINQSETAQLTLTALAPFAGEDFTPLPGTPGLTLAALATTAANTVSFEATLGSLTLTANTPSTDNSGYISADIDLSVYASSGFSFTDGVPVALEALTVSAQSPVAVENDGSVVVGVQQTPALTLTDFNVTAVNPVLVLPTTEALSLTEYAVTAGAGIAITATADSLALNGIQTSVTGTSRDFGSIAATRPGLSLDGLTAGITGIRLKVPVPESTFQVDFTQNTNATTDVPNNYEECAVSGFRARRGELVKRWDGVYVLPRFNESRHPQDFVRAVSDNPRGAKNPEGADRLIEQEYPNGVSASDL